MELFYSKTFDGNICSLGQEESVHCTKVMRHRAGDEICVIDGEGTMSRCLILDDSPKGVQARIVESFCNWGSHPYRLTMAVCPTKNMDRYEWFAEKATELGVDEIIPLIGEHSERKVLKTERLEKIVISAAKQSLKAAVPAIRDCESVVQFIKSAKESKSLKLIAYCFEDESVPRKSITEVLESCTSDSDNDITILIGPEGDFSSAEAELALTSGFVPIHLGPSRLRTETAAIASVAAVYYHFI